VQVAGEELQLYWADMHVHTVVSPQDEGHLDELYAYARDKAGLDVVAFSDNDQHYISLTASDFAGEMDFVRHFHEDGRFVLLPAYEWTYRAPSGPNHRTVIGADESLPLLRYTEVTGDPVRGLTAHAERHGALLHLHHETWELTASPAETNVEICSNWYVHMLDPGYRARLHAVLRTGRRLGFVANGDNHRRCPGTAGALTGIYAPSLTRAAILEALRRHRCFATDGSRIAVQLWADDTFMGDLTVADRAPVLRWTVHCTTPPATVTLIRDGEPLRTWQMQGREATGSHVDGDLAAGEHFYYLAVEQAGHWRQYPSTLAVAHGPRAWSSPVWVRR
jgi:hypothetical protein